jgi:Mn-dependent DtxR family transcriptional regulator
VPKYKTKQYSSLNFEEHMNIICSNDGAQAFFSPFGFPIHGAYDDYGHIDEIKRDKNVEQLEEFFGITIEDIIANISRVKEGEIKDLKNEEIYLSLGMTYFRTEVLEFIQRGWEKTDLVNPRKYSSEEYLKGFLDKVKAVPDRTLIEDIIKKKQEGIKLTEDEIDIYMDSIRSYSTWENCYIKCNSQYNFLKLLPIDFVAQQDEIVKQWKWLSKLSWGLDRVLIPSVYGGQEDNFIETYELNEFVNDLLIEDIKYYSDEWGEDADERSARILKAHNRNKTLRELGI